ncbi:hypothetical protein EK0264_15945 [Epidermidibacterium keratini]|uniref:Uncharacterized protein n=1 Tax=Epidermidibacterium keratini TaxID=1891644 RepID=A0A7L4YQV4_9ACTN|nr:hypothetical protein [Epidermidibacterium keratini]QHC01635.1 hypothetical protein EK0264_15945 [Epidermidibacterium keratini]
MSPTPFPLPRPTSEPVSVPINGGSFQLILRVAPELIGETRDIVDRVFAMAEAGRLTDGEPTMLGFNPYWLSQTGPQQFTVLTFDYRDTDNFQRTRTDDLTTALWIEAAQRDVVLRSGVGVAPSEVTLSVTVQRAAMDVLASGGNDSLVLARLSAPTPQQVEAGEARDSGWTLSTSEEAKRRGRRTEEVVSGRLVSLAPSIIPFLALPAGSAAEFNGATFRAAWQQTTPIRVFLDGSGAGAGRSAEEPAAPMPADASAPDGPGVGTPGVAAPTDEPAAGLQTQEHQVGELTLTTKSSTELAPNAASVVSHFARRTPEELRDGFAIGLGFNVFSLQQTGETTHAIMAPNYADPMSFHRERVDDLTVALRIAAAQAEVVRDAGVQASNTTMSDEVSVQRAAFDAYRSGAPEPLVFERVPLPQDQQVSAEGRRRSGWMLSVSRATSDNERMLQGIPAGTLVAMMPALVPFLQLPDDCVLSFAGQQFQNGYQIDSAKIVELATAHPGASMGELITEHGAGRRIL